MLPLRRQAAVCCDDRPAVIEDAYSGVSKVNHRFHGERHACLQAKASATSTCVRNVRVCVHAASNAVASELCHDAHPFLLSELRDRCPDVSEPRASTND